MSFLPKLLQTTPATPSLQMMLLLLVLLPHPDQMCLRMNARRQREWFYIVWNSHEFTQPRTFHKPRNYRSLAYSSITHKDNLKISLSASFFAHVIRTKYGTPSQAIQKFAHSRVLILSAEIASQ